MQPPVMNLSGATKIYGGRAVLEDVSLSVSAGTATALLGRNGSGKSTLLAILAGLLQLTSGNRQQRGSKLRIGYAPEALPGIKMSAEQYLRSMGRISGIKPALLEEQIGRLLADFHLEPFRKQQISRFSKGMLHKVNLIQSLLGEPELLLLDEPLSGLDLPAQRTLIAHLQQLKQGGTAFVFAVHEPLCIEALEAAVHVLKAGRTVMVTDAAQLTGRPESYLTCTALSEQDHLSVSQRRGLLAVEEVQDVIRGRCTGWTVETAFADDFLRHILQLGGSVVSVQHRSGRGGIEAWMDPKPGGEGKAG